MIQGTAPTSTSPSRQLQTLQFGPLQLQVETDSAKRLFAVRLPANPPAGLQRTHLLRALETLATFTPVLPAGPVFARKVWEALCRIPIGQTTTYGALAKALGSPGAARAVGQACARNPLLLLVPCHRVIASHGGGGYAAGMAWKTALLKLEIL